jgi:hypothetical protein
MATLLQSCMKGPDWQEVIVPDWFRERAEALIAQLGEDHPDSKVFRGILSTDKISEKAVDHLEFIAGKTSVGESIQLAIDLSQHCFATIKVMTLIPLRMA